MLLPLPCALSDFAAAELLCFADWLTNCFPRPGKQFVNGPVKCFSKTKILLFYGSNTGLWTPAGAGLWPEVWLQGKWVRKVAFPDTSQSWELPAHQRSCPALCWLSEITCRRGSAQASANH